LGVVAVPLEAPCEDVVLVAVALVEVEAGEVLDVAAVELDVLADPEAAELVDAELLPLEDPPQPASRAVAPSTASAAAAAPPRAASWVCATPRSVIGASV
jgi:hypothetical protein